MFGTTRWDTSFATRRGFRNSRPELCVSALLALRVTYIVTEPAKPAGLRTTLFGGKAYVLAVHSQGSTKARYVMHYGEEPRLVLEEVWKAGGQVRTMGGVKFSRSGRKW